MRTTTGWLAAAVAALAAAWLAAPAAVPLYDGIGFPDEPYRYVSPPAGYRKTPPPTRAFGTAPAGTAASGTSGPKATGAAQRSVNTRDLGIKSTEFGPQVEIYVAKGSLTGPTAVRGYQISAIPIAPDRPVPGAPGETPGTPGEAAPAAAATSGKTGGAQAGADVHIDGDVYRVKINCSTLPPTITGPAPAGTSCPATIVPHSAGGTAWIALRATSARRPPPVFLYRTAPSAAWRILPAHRGGRDFYTASLVGEGDYALTFPSPPRSPGAASSGSSKLAGGPPRTAIALIVVLAGIIVVIGTIRFTRSRHRRR